MIGIVKIVQHIDAAAKHHALINHAQFTVQPAPSQRQQHAPAGCQRRIHAPIHAGTAHFFLPLSRQRCRANAIDQHLNPYPALGSANQGISHARTCAEHVEQVSFHLHPSMRAVNCLNQRRKVRATAFQQLKIFSEVLRFFVALRAQWHNVA